MARPRCAGALVGDVDAVEPDDARGRVLEAGDQPQESGLAAPRGPDEDDEGAVLDLEATHRGSPAWPPKDLLTCSSVIEPMWDPLFHGAEGQAAHQLLLAEPAQHQDRRDGERRGGGQLGPEQALRD